MESAADNSNEIINPSNIISKEAPVSPKESSSSSSEEQPKPNDVLLGRASHIYNHPGNIRYRSIIASNQRKYHSCTTRLDKMIFIRQITKDILEDGAVKFWKMNKKGGEGKLWKEVDFRTVQDKVSHALRDGKNTNDSQLPFVDVIPSDYHKMEPTRPNRFPSSASTAAATTMNKPPIKTSLLSHIDQVLRSRSRDLNASIVDSLPKHHIVEDLPASARDYQSLAFADRQRNLRLASMASALQQDRTEHEFATAQHLHALQQHRSVGDRGIGSTQVFSPSSLLEHSAARSKYADKDSSFLMNDSHHSLMNQSNTVSQQLTPDDFLLHAMRKQRSFSNAPASAAAAAYAAAAARAESSTNQRVYGTQFPRKNLHSPPTVLPAMMGGKKIPTLREKSLIETLQKLKSQRVAEIQALEEQLRNVQN